jgi:hypothetical protein
MSVSLTAQWFAKVDHIRWDAFDESNDLEAHVVADPVYLLILKINLLIA